MIKDKGYVKSMTAESERRGKKDCSRDSMEEQEKLGTTVDRKQFNLYLV